MAIFMSKHAYRRDCGGIIKFRHYDIIIDYITSRARGITITCVIQGVMAIAIVPGPIKGPPMGPYIRWRASTCLLASSLMNYRNNINNAISITIVC